MTSEVDQQPSTYVTLISGTVAGIASTYSKQPLDRLKWLRQVSEGVSHINSHSYYRIGSQILKNEGIHGAFRGVTAACVRNIPHAAFIYTLFPKIEYYLISNTQRMLAFDLKNITFLI